MSTTPRLTPQTLLVVNAFLDRPGDWLYGLELIERLGVKGGTIYPLLARLERFGWLESKRESIDPAAAGRPRRRLYRLTGEGQRQSETAIERWRNLLSPFPDRPRAHGATA